MKNLIYKIAFIVCSMLILPCIIHAADCRVITDRDIYVSGEEVLMSVFVPNECNYKVINVKLTNSSGNYIQSVNLPLHDFRAGGHIYLPDSLSSGSYLVTAYSPYVECLILESKEIMILNRFENPDEPILLNRAKLQDLHALPVSDYFISGLKGNYDQGEKVEIKLAGDQGTGSLFSVSVSRCFQDWKPKHRIAQFKEVDSLVISSKDGVILQGKVCQLNTTEPVAGATVYLSIPDSIPFFDFCKTGNDGHFYFLLPHRYGTDQIVLQAEKNGEADKLQLLAGSVGKEKDDDFEVSPQAYLPGLNAYLSESIQLVTFNKIYQVPELIVDPIKNVPPFPFPFYGKSSLQIDPDDYLELDDFIEISRELLETVRFRERKGEYSIQILDNDFRSFMSGKPMVLIDGVPLSDLSRLASMGSNEIDRIDVVPYQRFYGDLKMDGVLAVYTKEGDASLVSSSPHLLKMEFEELQPEVQLAEMKNSGVNEPDFHQLLYWNPEFNQEEGQDIKFKTPNINGTFRVYVVERTADGRLFERIEYFTVSH